MIGLRFTAAAQAAGRCKRPPSPAGVGGADNARQRLLAVGQHPGDVDEVAAGGHDELEGDDPLGIVTGVDVGQLDEAAYQQRAPYAQDQGDADRRQQAHPRVGQPDTRTTSKKPSVTSDA